MIRNLKSTALHINSYINSFLVAKKHPPTTDLQVDDGKKKRHNTFLRMQIDPLNIGPRKPPLGRSN